MQEGNDPSLGVNSWLEEELYHQYRFDRQSVDEGWTDLFVHAEDQNGAGVNGNVSPGQESEAQSSVAVETEPEPVREPPAKPEPQKEPPKPEPPRTEPPRNEPPKTELTKAAPVQPAKPEPKTVGASDQLIPLRGAAARIAENMTLSLSIPVATSQRQIPVRVIEENRNLINKRRVLKGQSKLSFTQLIAWAIVKALKANAGLNHAYAENGGEPFRVVRGQVNLGLAIDIAAKDGTRSLKVPNIKNADGMNFAQFVAAYDDIVARARTNKLQVADFEGTTISLTNPGTVGTFGSVPRLMPGQGATMTGMVLDQALAAGDALLPGGSAGTVGNVFNQVTGLGGGPEQQAAPPAAAAQPAAAAPVAAPPVPVAPPAVAAAPPARAFPNSPLADDDEVRERLSR